MEIRELNRDYKRLFKAGQVLSSSYSSAENEQKYWDQKEKLQKELSRLYYADSAFKYINHTSILIFLSLNQSWRVIPFHQVHPEINL